MRNKRKDELAILEVNPCFGQKNLGSKMISSSYHILCFIPHSIPFHVHWELDIQVKSVFFFQVKLFQKFSYFFPIYLFLSIHIIRVYS